MILVNDCSFHHIKSLSNNISHGQIGGVEAVPQGRKGRMLASKTHSCFPRLVKVKSVAQNKQTNKVDKHEAKKRKKNTRQFASHLPLLAKG